jgi:hypothetical protein
VLGVCSSIVGFDNDNVGDSEVDCGLGRNTIPLK